MPWMNQASLLMSRKRKRNSNVPFIILNRRELAKAVDRLEKSIQNEYPTGKHIFIEAESITRARPSGNDKELRKDN